MCKALAGPVISLDEPTVGRFVINQTSGEEGLVIEVRTKAGRVILLEDNTTVTEHLQMIGGIRGIEPSRVDAVATGLIAKVGSE